MNTHILLPLFVCAWLISTPVLCWFARRELTWLGVALLPFASAIFLYSFYAYLAHEIGVFSRLGIVLVIFVVMSRFQRKKAPDVAEGTRS